MHRIIGGEFAIDSEKLSKSNKKELQYSTGRSVLYSILMHIGNGFGRILLPNYLCDSITQTVIDTGWTYDFYQVDESLHIQIDSCLFENGYNAILLINYFGMINLVEDIKTIREKKPELIIIEDDVQAYYSLNSSSADYSFTSLRKWFPCPDGALLHTCGFKSIKPCIKNENKWSQYKLAGNILKSQSDYIDDALSLSLLDKGEALLTDEYLSPCSDASQYIFANLDLEKIADKRKQNAEIIHEELERLCIKHLYSDNCVPLFVPIFVENRDILRKTFFSKQIYTPKHWPKVTNTLNGNNILYDVELSLICDQRYGTDDILRQISVLKNFY